MGWDPPWEVRVLTRARGGPSGALRRPEDPEGILLS